LPVAATRLWQRARRQTSTHILAAPASKVLGLPTPGFARKTARTTSSSSSHLASVGDWQAWYLFNKQF